MFKRFLQIGGLVAVGTLAAAAIGSAAESQTEFNRTSASLTVVSGPNSTHIDVSRGTTEFQSDKGEFVRSGTFVNVFIFDPTGPQFGCFQVADTAFSGGLQGATLDATVGPGVGNCGGGIKGTIGAGALGGGGGGGPTGLRQALVLHLVWNPAGAVNHDTFSNTHTCLDFSSSSQTTRDSVRASLTGSINGSPVTVTAGPGIAGGGGDNFAFANLSTEQGQFSTESPNSPQPGCGFFKG
jgi:hypothetical protein